MRNINVGASQPEGTVKTVQGWLNKVIMGMAEEEEIRIVYDSSKYVRGEKLSRKQRSEVSRNALSS